MHKKIIKFALVLLATASSIFAWTQATLINNTNELWLELETNETGNFDNTWFNIVSENLFDITNVGNGNWNFSYEGDNYTNIRRISTNNGGFYYGTQRYIFWNNGNLTINTSNGGGSYWTVQCPKRKKLDYNGYQNVNNFTDTGFTYTINDINNEITSIDKEIFGSISVDGAHEMSATDNKNVYCIKAGQSIYCNVSFAGSRGNTPYCYGETTPINLGLSNTITITDIAQNNLNEASPFNSSGGGNGGGNSTDITQYSCPTIQQLINTYGDQYNTGLCYSSTLIYTGGTLQTIEPKTIFELYPTYTGFTQAINLYYNYCTAPATQETCNNAFEGNELGRTIINKLPNDVKKGNIYQYCNLQLNYEDKNATTCTLGQTGILAPGITINDIVNEIGNQDITVVTPGTPPEGEEGNGSGSIFNDLIGENTEETERRNIIENAKNIVQTMKEQYAKFTGIFRGRSGTEGFIPEYITGMLLLIILYKLFKK